MKGDKVLVMTSLVIIFAVFLRRRRSFIQQMRLMSFSLRKHPFLLALRRLEEDATKYFNSV